MSESSEDEEVNIEDKKDSSHNYNIETNYIVMFYICQDKMICLSHLFISSIARN